MKVLVLGNSDTAGLFHRGKLWTQIVQEGLAARTEELDWQEMNFLVVSRSAPATVEARVRDFQPDLVLMPVGSFMWSVTFVSMRVRKLLGSRAGAVYRRAETGFDARTRRKGAVRDRMNRLVRALARRTIGAAPFATQEQVTAATRGVLNTLARIEATQVVVIGYPPESPAFLRGKLRERRLRFMADVARAAQEHHFLWISGDRALEEAGVTEPITTPDGFHFNALGHRVHGEYVLNQVIAHVAPLAGGSDDGSAASMPSGQASQNRP